MKSKECSLKDKTKMAKSIVKYLFILLITAFLIFILIDLFFIPFYWYISPHGALKAFKTRQCAEGQQIHPLIVSGKKTLPLIIDEIKNKNMVLRIYAIIALGEIGDQSALPVLENILNDNDEDHVTRLGALRAIALIDYKLAKKYAKELYEKGYDWIKNHYVSLYNTNNPPDWYFSKKSFWDAWFDRYE